MHPVLLETTFFGLLEAPWALHSYGVLLFLGRVAAITTFFLVVQRDWPEEQRTKVGVPALVGFAFLSSLFGLLAVIGFWIAWRNDRENKYFLYLWLFPGIVFVANVVSRIVWLVFFGRDALSSIGIAALWRGGSIFYVAFIVALIVLVIVALRGVFPFWRTADVAVPAGSLAWGIGRVGCFMAGCCYGRPCTDGGCVSFPPGSLAATAHLDQGMITDLQAASLPVYPVQLYDAIGLLLIGAVTLLLFKRASRFDGQFAILTLVAGLGLRIWTNGYRGDRVTAQVGSVSTTTIVTVFFILVLAAIFVVLAVRSRKREVVQVADTRTSATETSGEGP